MGDSLRIEGADAMKAVASALKKAENGREVRKHLLSELRKAGKPAADKMLDGLREALPKKGGANRMVPPKRIAVRNRLNGKNAGIQLDTLEAHDYQSIEHDGQLRHPKWPGHRPKADWRWAVTPIGRANVMHEAVEGELPRFLDAVGTALNDAMRELL